MNRAVGWGVPLLWLAAACHRPPPNSAAATRGCDDADMATAALPPGATADGLGGEYHLRLSATTGPASGTSVDGRLTLRELPDSLRRPPPILGLTDSTTHHVLAGTADIDPPALGAHAPGDLASTDLRAPGVLVLERHPSRAEAPAELMIRLGADANRRGVVRYDGGYFALTIRRLSPAGFAGTWASGAVGPTASGRFCAERAGP